MTMRRLVSLITGVLIIAIFLPIALSLWLANRQANELFNQEMNSYAERVLARTQRVKVQAKTALEEINRYQGAPCTLGHLRQIQKISYIHQYIQSVFYLENHDAPCELLSNTLSEKIPGTEFTTPAGYTVWLTSRHDLQTDAPMMAVSHGKYMVMVDPDSLIDVLPDPTYPIYAALINAQSHRVIASNHPLDPEIWEHHLQTDQPVIQFNDTLYHQRVLPDVGAILLTWSSMKPLSINWHRQLMLWLPLGLLISGLASYFMVRLLRRLQSSHYRVLAAIKAKEITVHYQPVVSLEDGRLLGAEALARWQQADGRWLPPDLFIAIAEQTGVICQLTEHIVRGVFADLGGWLSQHPEMTVSINITAADLSSPTLPALLRQQIQQWNVAPHQIALELTERDLIAPQTARPVLQAYREMGHKVYIDDFGVGYSSLSYLQELEVDTLKIDKSFVDALEHKVVTGHIIEIAKSLNLSMIAEGIETAHQRDWLYTHGVPAGQGWFYSKALPKKAFIQWAQEKGPLESGDASLTPRRPHS
ncbi:EAL domain-containing protein [Kluyvera chengduensis]|uniref:EAL domain-containing protein n=1 Tax=Kluyvera sp. 142359 TaxID=3375726 RepID=UPI0037741840